MGLSYWAWNGACRRAWAELVSLPQGSSIYSNQDSLAMMAGGVAVKRVASINNSMDIEQLAAQLARRFSKS